MVDDSKENAEQDALVDGKLNKAGNEETEAKAVKDETYRDQVLPEDAYTFIHVAPLISIAHTIALLIFMTQVTILAIFGSTKLTANKSDDRLSDNFDSSAGNPFKIPLRVSAIVTVSQILALFITLMYNLSDLTRFVHLFGHPTFKNPLKEGDSFSRMKYIISHLLRIAMSLLVIMVSLLIIVQSENAIDLFLDFVAVSFVGELDDLVYSLMDKGVLGTHLQDLLEKIKRITIVKRSNPCKRVTSFVLIFTFAVLLGCLAWAKGLQYGNAFQVDACQNFELNIQDDGQNQGITIFQFGKVLAQWDMNEKYENWNIDYRHFNGRYTSLDNSGKGNKPRMVKNRPVFYQEGRYDMKSLNVDGNTPFDPIYDANNIKPGGKISYCKGSRRWVFTIPGITKGGTPDPTGCDWLMRSGETKAYTLEEVPTDNWDIWSGQNTGLIQTISDTSFLTCRHCNDEADCNYHGTCEFDKSLQTKSCICETIWTGEKCNLCAGCKTLKLNIEEEGAPILQQEDEVDVYGRAVYRLDTNYYGYYNDTNSEERITALLYTGSHFVIGAFTASVDNVCGLRDSFPIECGEISCCKYDTTNQMCELNGSKCNGFDKSVTDKGVIDFRTFLTNYHPAWVSPHFLIMYQSVATTLGYPTDDLMFRTVAIEDNEDFYDNNEDFYDNNEDFYYNSTDFYYYNDDFYYYNDDENIDINYTLSMKCIPDYDPAECTPKFCTSPDENNGTDCWAGRANEPCKCSIGAAKVTWEEREHEGGIQYQYVCCTNGDGTGESCGLAKSRDVDVCS